MPVFFPNIQVFLQGVLIDDFRLEAVEGDIEGIDVVHDVVAVIHVGFNLVGHGRAVRQRLAVGVVALPHILFVRVGVVNVVRNDHAVAGAIVRLCCIFINDGEVFLFRIVLIRYGVTQLLGIPEQAEVQLSQRIGIGDGIVLVAGSPVDNVGVGANHNVVIGPDRDTVKAGLFRIIIEHRSIGPVAVEAHKRHGQIHVFFIGIAEIEEALYKHAVLEALSQIILVFLRQGDLRRQAHRLTGGNRDLGHSLVTAGGNLSQQIHVDFHLRAVSQNDIHIGAVGLAVAVYVGIGIMYIVRTQSLHPGNMPQENPSIGGGDGAVVIEVILQNIGGHIGKDLGVCIQRIRRIFNEFAAVNRFGQGRNIEGIGLIRILGEVGDLEGELVHAVTLRIIAELALRPVLIGIGAGEVGFRGSGLHQVDQAGALVSGRVLFRVAVHHGIGRAEHNVGCHPAQHIFLELGIVRPQVLHQDGHGAGNLGSCHGGTAHETVTGGVVPGGVDVAAHTGDFRLQLQIRGAAPGGEIAHHLVGNKLFAGTADHQHLLLGLRHQLAVGFADTNSGDAAGGVGDAHVHHACYIVIYNTGNRACGLGIGLLNGEVHLAATLHDGHLTGQIQALEVGGLAVAFDHHILQFLSGKPDQLGVDTGIAVSDLGVAHSEIQHGSFVIVYRGHGKGLEQGAGGTDQADIRIAGLGHVPTQQVVQGVISVVACGNQHLHIRLGEGVQNLGHRLGAGGKAGGATQRQVHGVHIQPDAVFHRSQDGVPVGAPAAKDLHHDQLGLRGDAHHIGGVQLVRSRDTGHVGAVVAASRGVRDVQASGLVVKGIGDLGAVIYIGRANSRAAGIQAGPNFLYVFYGHRAFSQLILTEGSKAGMAQYNAGVQNGHLHALAGVAGAVEHVGANHLGGIVRHGLKQVVRSIRYSRIFRHLERGSYVHALHAGHGGNGIHVAVFRLHGQTGGGNRISIAQLKGIAAAEAAGQPGLHGIQSRHLPALVRGHRSGIGRDVVGGEARSQQGVVLQLDNQMYHIGIRIALNGFRLGEGSGVIVNVLTLALRQSDRSRRILVRFFCFFRYGRVSDERYGTALLAHLGNHSGVHEAAACSGSHGHAGQKQSQYQNKRQESFFHVIHTCLSYARFTVSNRSITVAIWPRLEVAFGSSFSSPTPMISSVATAQVIASFAKLLTLPASTKSSRLPWLVVSTPLKPA